STIGEEGMGDLMCNRVTEPLPGTGGIELDSKARPTNRNSSCVANVVLGDGFDAKKVGQMEGIKRRAFPSGIKRLQHQSACPLRYHLDRIAAGGQLYHRRVSPPALLAPHG